MNHRSSGSLVLTKAITGFINYKTAEGLTFSSVDSYRRALERWAEHIGEIDIGRITHQSISDYLLYLRTEYVPRRFSGDTRALSGKTLRNVYVTLASFFASSVSQDFVPVVMMIVNPGPSARITKIYDLWRNVIQTLVQETSRPLGFRLLTISMIDFLRQPEFSADVSSRWQDLTIEKMSGPVESFAAGVPGRSGQQAFSRS